MRIPVVLNVQGPVIIFGGGEVGRRKVDYVLKFTDNVTVIDEKKVDLPGPARLIIQKVDPQTVGGMIPDDAALVIAALDAEAVNRAIALNCSERGIMVNVVDVPDPSTVLFQALSKAGDMTLSVSTSGKCPFLARKIREELDDSVDQWEQWLRILAPIREKLVGIEEKNRVLQKVYDDRTLKSLVAEGKIEDAEKKAWEVYKNVCG